MTSDADLVEYIWKNYRNLIDRETGYLSMVRALAARTMDADRRKSFLQSHDWDYFEWPLEKLSAELATFQGEKRREVGLAVAKKYAESIRLNLCPNCGSLPIAPNSEHCLRCHHSWHGENPLRSAPPPA